MKIEVKKQISETVDIELPYYSKSTTDFYCVLSEKKVINVECWCDEFGIRTSDYLLACAMSDRNTPITKEEFESKLAEVKQKINSL